MVVTGEKQPFGDPGVKGDKTWELKVLSGAPEVIRTPGLLISADGGLYPAELRAASPMSKCLSSSRPFPLFRYRSRLIASARVVYCS